jgi:hypothetical protein
MNTTTGSKIYLPMAALAIPAAAQQQVTLQGYVPRE